MNFRATSAVIIFSFLIGGIMGFWLAKGQAPDMPTTSIRYLPSTALFDVDTNFKPATPKFRYIYSQGETKPEVVEKKVYIPVSYSDDYLLTPRDPIAFRRNMVQFRYYDPIEGAEIMDEFQFVDRRLRYNFYIDTSMSLIQAFGPVRNIAPAIGPRFSLQYRSTELSAGSYYDFKTRDFHTLIGLSVRVAGN